MPQIIETDAIDVKSWLEAGEAILIDVREENERTEARISCDEVHVPLTSFDPQQVPVSSGKKLVFACAHGIRSYQVGQYMLDQGFIVEAYNLKDGIAGWHQSGLPLETG